MASLYSAQTIVTGQGEANRAIGFRACLGKVLVKVSGDQTITAAKGFAALLPAAGTFVDGFRYHDRLQGVPIHDEQGTHDRPHDLTCLYRPSVLDHVLGGLGRKPWLSARPPLAVFLDVAQNGRRFRLSSDGGESPYMVASLQAAAGPMAMQVTVPAKAALEQDGLGATPAIAAAPAALLHAAHDAGAEVALAGSLDWSDKELGWIARWRLVEDGRATSWQIRGVSFDDAFRNAIGGAAQVLSGNGPPKSPA